MGLFGPVLELFVYALEQKPQAQRKLHFGPLKQKHLTRMLLLLSDIGQRGPYIAALDFLVQGAPTEKDAALI